MPEALKLYYAPASPNSRRVRMFLAEKGISVPLVSVDLGAGEQARRITPMSQFECPPNANGGGGPRRRDGRGRDRPPAW
jgi:hypothetical protein